MYRIVFEHHPKPGQEKEFVAAWQRGSDKIQQYPGARGTKLFRSLSNTGVLYAMAEWDSKTARDDAMAEIAKRDDAESMLHAHEKFLESHVSIVSAELIVEVEAVEGFSTQI